MIVGIDIGAAGALALVTPEGDLVEVADMPILHDGPKGRPTVNGPLLADLLRRWGPSAAYVEFVSSRGMVEGALATLGIPATMLTPPTWKRAVGIPPGRDGAKDAARSEAIRRWPRQAAAFQRVKDDGRAEAALIAVAGLARSKAA